MAVVFDPRWPRSRLARVGCELANEWVTLNRLPPPDRVFLDRESANAARRCEDARSKFLIRPEWLGAYQRRWKGGWSAIAVDVQGCPTLRRLDLGTRTLWHAPGSYEDFTPLGVVCHELGHHVDFTLHLKAYSRVNGFQSVLDNEEDVSSVEHNVLESFAEAIRLFVTNPDLLRRGRPDRYEYLTKGVGLKPLHRRPWRTVLSKAGKRVLSAAERWILSA